MNLLNLRCDSPMLARWNEKSNKMRVGTFQSKDRGTETYNTCAHMHIHTFMFMFWFTNMCIYICTYMYLSVCACVHAESISLCIYLPTCLSI